MAKISDILKGYRKSVGSTSAAESPMAKVSDWLSFGNYAINHIISGNIYKGCPMGRITTLYGESGSGKSFLAANAVVDALKNKGFQLVVIFDSEGGVLFNYIESQGVDMTKIEHVPVHSIEDCGVKMIQLYDSLVKAAEEWKKNPEGNEEPKVLCILDSWGGISSDKLINDALKDKMATEMGISAKQKNNLLRGLIMRTVESNCPLIILNHTYDDPGAMMPSKIKAIAGGKGVIFSSHVIVQLTKLLIKAGNNDYLTGKESDDDTVGFYKGNRVNAFTVKNRVMKPGFSADIYIDFNSSISKWDGLIPDAIQYGFIKEVYGGYNIPSYSDKKVTYKQLVSNDEIWNTFIDKFNEVSEKKMSYGNSTTEEIEKIESEFVENLESTNDTIDIE